MTDFYDRCSFENSLQVSRARLLCEYPWVYASGMTATEVRSILATTVVLW